MSGVITKFRDWRKRQTKSANEIFIQTVSEVWSGEPISEERIASVLLAAGKSDEDFDKELSALDRIAELRKKIIDVEAVKTEMRELSRQTEAAMKEWQTLKDTAMELGQKNEARRRFLSAQIQASQSAERELARIGKSNPNDPQAMQSGISQLLVQG